jgi:DNA polymerase III sliding clamp (beta) subunit (PCNA family)
MTSTETHTVVSRTPLSGAPSAGFGAVVAREPLLEALREAGKIVGQRPSIPVLGAIKLRDAELPGHTCIEATDCELFYRRLIPAEMTGSGEVVVPLRPLKQLVAKAPKGTPVELSQACPITLRVGIGPRAASIQTHRPEDFPATPDTGNVWRAVPAGDLLPALAVAPIPASIDEDRPILTSVAFYEASKGMELASTDSHRMGIIHIPLPFGWKRTEQVALVPARAAYLFSCFAARSRPGALVTMCFGEFHGEFRVGTNGPVLGFRLVKGEYLHWRQLVPTGPFVATICLDADEILSALEAAMAVAGSLRPVIVEAEEGEVRIRASEAFVGEVWQSLEKAVHEGEDLRMGFNPELLSSAVRFLGASNITLKVVDPTKGVLIEGRRPEASDERRFLLMPVRLGNSR